MFLLSQTARPAVVPRGYHGAFPEAKSPGRVGAAGVEVMSGTVLLLIF